MFASFEEAENYLSRAPGMSLGLDAIRALLDSLGHPERKLKFIHITGTNGKGSVSAYLESALAACGVRAGCYSTPAVFDWRETISLGGVWIEESEAVAALSATAEAAERIKAEYGISPTRFELETAAALVYFAKANCELIVWEVGLGGRLDATNAVENTLAAVFTPIGVDHAAILGATVMEIAQEKAGIIKPHCKVVSTVQPDSARAVLLTRAEELGCPILFTDRAEIGDCRDGMQALTVGGVAYSTRMLGEHQAYNLPAALAVIEALRECGFVLPEDRVKTGIAGARLPGRFDFLGVKPDFIIDGAHNPHAARNLASNLARYERGKKLIFLLGILRDKDVEGILDFTLDSAAEVFTFDWENPRALSGAELAERIRARGKAVTYAGSVEEAVRTALTAANVEDCIVAFGSLSHLKEIKARYEEVRYGR